MFPDWSNFMKCDRLNSTNSNNHVSVRLERPSSRVDDCEQVFDSTSNSDVSDSDSNGSNKHADTVQTHAQVHANMDQGTGASDHQVQQMTNGVMTGTSTETRVAQEGMSNATARRPPDDKITPA